MMLFAKTTEMSDFKIIKHIPNSQLSEHVKLDPWKIKEIENVVKNEVDKSIRNIILLTTIPLVLPLILYVWIYYNLCVDGCVYNKSNKPGKYKIDKKEKDGFMHPNGVFIPARPKSNFEVRPIIKPDVDDLYALPTSVQPDIYALQGAKSDNDLLNDEHLYVNLSNLDLNSTCDEDKFLTKIHKFMNRLISPFVHVKHLIGHFIQNCDEYMKCKSTKTTYNVHSGGPIVFKDSRPVPPRRFEYMAVQPESAYIELHDVRNMYGVLTERNDSSPAIGDLHISATCDQQIEGNYMDLTECHYEAPNTSRQNDYDIELDSTSSEEVYTTLF